MIKLAFKLRTLSLAFSFLGIVGVAYAQPGKPTGGGVDNQSQDVVKNFDARLIETEKIKINPVLPAVDTSIKAQSYTVPNKVLPVEYQTPKMRPVSVPTQKLPPSYNGYAKLGYGFPNSPYGEAAYRFGNPEKYLVGLKARHHSADNKKVENQRFSLSGGEVTGIFYANAGIAVDAKVGFDNNTRQFYGYDHTANSYTRGATKQKFDIFSTAAKVYNSARTVADFNYSLGLDFSNILDDTGNKERDFNVVATGMKWFNEKHPLNLTVKAEFTNFSPGGGLKEQSLNNISILPSFTYKANVFSIKLGANLISSDDIFFPLPDIEASGNISGTVLQVFAGWKGDFKKNSYKNLVTYNPFLKPRDTFKIRNTQQLEYYGGVKGNFSGVNYSAQAGWSDNANLALFVSDTADQFRRFSVLYDSVGIFNIRGAVSLFVMKNLELTGTVSQNIYNTKKEKAAWGLPSLDINVGAKYTVAQKGNLSAVVKGGFFVQNGVNVRRFDGESTRLKPLFDLNLGGEVWFSKNIGVFLDLNNILDLKRERWQYHPNLGLNLLGGVTARF
jgi:hypothetical protein